jgi:hypothetical protein
MADAAASNPFTAQPPAKACSICGIDVTTKPRVKDGQGRYACQDCFDRAKQAKGVATPPPIVGAIAAVQPPKTSAKAAADLENDNAFLLNLNAVGSDGVASDKMKPCPSCNRWMKHNDVLCTGCGFNLETNRRTSVKVVKTKAVKQKSGPSFSIPEWVAPVVFLAVVGGLFALGTVEPIGFAFGFIVVWLTLVVCHLWIAIEAGRDSVGKGLLVFFVPFVDIYYALTDLENRSLRAVFLCCYAIGVFLNIAMSTGMIDLKINDPNASSQQAGSNGSAPPPEPEPAPEPEKPKWNPF